MLRIAICDNNQEILTKFQNICENISIGENIEINVQIAQILRNKNFYFPIIYI